MIPHGTCAVTKRTPRVDTRGLFLSASNEPRSSYLLYGKKEAESRKQFMKSQLELTPADKDLVQKLRILVTDDQEINRKLLERLLTTFGCNKALIDYAKSGEEAVTVYSKNKYDMLFMDIRMAGIGGIEAARQIRKIQDQEKRKAFLVAASSEQFENESLQENKMDAQLQKPFLLEDLPALFKKALQIVK